MGIDESFEAREIDTCRPSAARMYDLYLDGENHFTVDIMFAERAYGIFPWLKDWARYNRSFLQRATRYCAQQGIRQFLDIGAGIPTAGNTHQVVHQLIPDAHVVYVDSDLVAVNQSMELLEREEAANTTVIEADLRDPESIFHHAETQRLIDFDQPVALLIISVLPFIKPEDNPQGLMEHYRAMLPQGSYLALSHVSLEDATPEVRNKGLALVDAYRETTDPITLRSRAEFTLFFDNLEIVRPGIVYAADWQPDQPVDQSDPARPCNFAAVGYKQ